MPFPQQERIPFAKAGVGVLNPNQTGCYGIFDASGTPVYIGKGDIRDRLLAHVNGDNPCILRCKPSYCLTVLANPPEATEKKLIAEYDPICNRRIG